MVVTVCSWGADRCSLSVWGTDVVREVLLVLTDGCQWQCGGWSWLGGGVHGLRISARDRPGEAR